ncbi:MAG: M6 family metalloprotease domain-containing protein [Muribaculaceae bacterium]|nr:M6 family metalloprotease domain-containing protein [Muribaculaceae bacterium]
MKSEFKQLILASILLSGTTAQMSAVPAYPGLMKIRQADGTEIEVRRIGDEYCNAMLTNDGYPLVYNSSTLNYEYARPENGNFVSTGLPVCETGKKDSRVIEILAGIDRNGALELFDRNWEKARKEAQSKRGETRDNKGMHKIVRISDVPTIGKHDVLVILVDFADWKFSDCVYTPDPAEYYDRFFHEKGFSEFGATGSAYDYYFDGSDGRYDPQFKVYGPVQVSGGYSDYAGGDGTMFVYKMIDEAVRLVDEQYDVDFNMFDTDGDGKVDNVYCLYAGYGQADSMVGNSIWPHSYNMSARNAQFDVDGVTIDRYTVSQQINGQTDEPVGIGTFVHEFGHVLGFADHYNNSSSMGSPLNNVGQWDVMSSGSYNNNQNTPPLFSAFERYSLGWCEPEELDSKYSEMVEIDPYDRTGQCYRVSVTKDDHEYFLIENRQQNGWDTYLPGHGVLVWHIEEDQQTWDKNKPNSDQAHQMVDIVESSGIFSSGGSSGDPFPGSKNIIAYSFKDWNNKEAFSFDWVEESVGSTCRFLLGGTSYRIPEPSLEICDLMGTSASLSVKGNGPAISYDIEVTDSEGVVLAATLEEEAVIPLSGLKPETEYTVMAKARLTSLESENQTLSFTTLPLQIEEKKPVAYPARDEKGGFTARWQHIPEATDYVIDIYASTQDGDGELNYGFDDFSTSAQNLPDGWTLTAKQGRYENDFGNAAPSLRLRDEGATLFATVEGYPINQVDFWFMPGKAGLILTLEGLKDGEWKEIWNHVSDRKREGRESVETNGVEAVRFIVTREDGVTGGYVLIDDISLHYLYYQFSLSDSVMVGQNSNEKYEADEDGCCFYQVSGLDSEGSYAYSVQGVSGDRTSIKSDIVNVESLSGMDIETLQEEDQLKDNIIYNLQGMRINRGLNSLPSGIYIVNGKKIIVRR